MSYGEKAVHLPIELLAALGDDPATWYPDLRVESIICDAIRAWIAPAPPAQAQQSSAAADAGYQWKQVFLPDGTRLRAKFGRETWHATVQEGQIKFGEHLVSPSCFANLHGSGNRNAWKAVWLRFPGTEQWVLADTCRTMQKAAIARLFAGDAPAAAQPSCAKQSQPRNPPESPSLHAAEDQPAPRAGHKSAKGAPAASQHNGTQAVGSPAHKGKNKRRRRGRSRAKKNASANPASAPPTHRTSA